MSCVFSCLELAAFLVGAGFILRWFLRLVSTIQSIYWGTPVTPERYGPKGSWAVVTGSTDGIGKAVALELAERGFNLVLISRSMEKLNATAREVQEVGQKAGAGQTRVIAFDFAEDVSIEAYKALERRIADLDVAVLVNNVGVSLDSSVEGTYKSIAVNCYPIVLLTQQLVNRFIERFSKNKQRSIIINLASQAAEMPIPYLSTYSACKAFDDYLSRGLSSELSFLGVDVLSVLPGMVSSAMTGEPPNPKKTCISAQDCARGILDNATQGSTYGGTLHKITGFNTSIIIDLVPKFLIVKGAGVFGKMIQDKKIADEKKN